MKAIVKLLAVVASFNAVSVGAQMLSDSQVNIRCGLAPSDVRPAVSVSVTQLPGVPARWRYTYTVTSETAQDIGPLDRFAILKDGAVDQQQNPAWFTSDFRNAGQYWLSWTRLALTGYKTVETFVLESEGKPSPILWAASTVPRAAQPARTWKILADRMGAEGASEYLQEQLQMVCADRSQDFVREPRIGVTIGPGTASQLNASVLAKTVSFSGRDMGVVALAIMPPPVVGRPSEKDVRVWVGTMPVIVSEVSPLGSGFQVLGLPHRQVPCGQAGLRIEVGYGPTLHAATLPFPERNCDGLLKQKIVDVNE